jgi:hypothetical protein
MFTCRETGYCNSLSFPVEKLSIAYNIGFIFLQIKQISVNWNLARVLADDGKDQTTNWQDMYLKCLP